MSSTPIAVAAAAGNDSDNNEKSLPTTTTTTLMVHEFVLQRVDDRFEVEPGENWLRLLPKEGHSVLDDTQPDMSQEDEASTPFYPSIVSLSSVGQLDAPSSDCYICVDLDGDTLAIKDMRRLPAGVGAPPPQIDENGDEEEPPPQRVVNQLGIFRTNTSSNKDSWEPLPRRQLRIVKPGDHLCTSLASGKPDGLVLEYKFGPKQPQKENESQKQMAREALGLLTQPEEGEDEDANENENENEETQTEVSANSNNKEESASFQGLQVMTNESDSDKTVEMSQMLPNIPLAQPSAALAFCTQPKDASDDETTLGEQDTGYNSNSMDVDLEEVITPITSSKQEEEKAQGAIELPPLKAPTRATKKKELIKLDLIPEQDDEEGAKTESESTPKKKEQQDDTNEPDEAFPQTAITLSPALCGETEDAPGEDTISVVADHSQEEASGAISVTLLCETGQEVVLPTKEESSQAFIENVGIMEDSEKDENEKGYINDKIQDPQKTATAGRTANKDANDTKPSDSSPQMKPKEQRKEQDDDDMEVNLLDGECEDDDDDSATQVDGPPSYQKDGPPIEKEQEANATHTPKSTLPAKKGSGKVKEVEEDDRKKERLMVADQKCDFIKKTIEPAEETIMHSGSTEQIPSKRQDKTATEKDQGSAPGVAQVDEDENVNYELISKHEPTMKCSDEKKKMDVIKTTIRPQEGKDKGKTIHNSPTEQIPSTSQGEKTVEKDRGSKGAIPAEKNGEKNEEVAKDSEEQLVIADKESDDVNKKGIQLEEENTMHRRSTEQIQSISPDEKTAENDQGLEPGDEQVDEDGSPDCEPIKSKQQNIENQLTEHIRPKAQDRKMLEKDQEPTPGKEKVSEEKNANGELMSNKHKSATNCSDEVQSAQETPNSKSRGTRRRGQDEPPNLQTLQPESGSRSSKRSRGADPMGTPEQDYSISKRPKQEAALTENSTRRVPKRNASPAKSTTCSTSARKRSRLSLGTKSAKDDNTPSIRVMTTGIELTNAQKHTVKRIGGVLLDKVVDAATATHVIAGSPLRRTPKLMIGLCRTSNIVNLDWLQQSAKDRNALPSKKFLMVNDKEAEDQYSFNMRNTLTRASKMRSSGKSLLGGYSVFVCTGVAGNKEKGNRTPPLEEFRLILEAAGAIFIKALPSASKKSTIFSPIIILVSKDEKEAQRQLAMQKVAEALKKGAIAKTTEEIFDAVMTQEFEL